MFEIRHLKSRFGYRASAARQGHSTARSSASTCLEGDTVRRRPRHQVVVQLMPGSEPYIRVECGTWSTALPATCSLADLWDVLEHKALSRAVVRSEAHVRVPLSKLKSLGLT